MFAQRMSRYMSFHNNETTESSSSKGTMPKQSDDSTDPSECTFDSANPLLCIDVD